jgi:hypothetical protein
VATWRSGYAADCKSPPFFNSAKPLARNGYQDKPETPGEPDNRANTLENQLGRLDRVLASTRFALSELRRTDRPGALSGELAATWRHLLGPAERAFLQAVAVQAAEPEHREELGFILGGPPPFRMAP